MTSLDASTVVSMIVHWSDLMWVLCLIFWMGLVVSQLEISKLSDSCQTGDLIVRMDDICLYWYVKVREQGASSECTRCFKLPILLYLSLCLPFEIFVV
jgi:hypothetical protein